MAVQLPPELFQLIIHFLCGGYSKHFTRAEGSVEQRLDVSKRELGTCSLVCRHWASRLRPDIFAKLSLRSRVDAESFFDLAQSSIWPRNSIQSVTAYVKSLKLEQDIHSPTFIHLFTHFVPNIQLLLPNLGSIRVSIQALPPIPALTPIDKLEDQMPTPQSLYGSLPRRLPASSSWYSLQQWLHFELVNITFAQFRDVLPFVAGIPTIDALEFRAIRFLETEFLDAPPAPGLLRSRRRIPSDEVFVRECDTVWPFVWILVTTRRARVDPIFSEEQGCTIYVVHSELSCIVALIKCVIDDCNCVSCIHHKEALRKQSTVFSVECKSNHFLALGGRSM